MFYRRMTAYFSVACLALASCTPKTGGEISAGGLGPQSSSSFFSSSSTSVERVDWPKLDVVIPVFDPGLSADAEDYQEEGIWPELRRAEANRFAFKLKAALEDTGQFGAVRVTPDKTATGDLYILGRIEESNGEDVEIAVSVFDISGDRWFKDTFDLEVDEGFYKNPRNRGKDPYDPLFTEAAQEIAAELDDFERAEVEELKNITDLRFGRAFSEEAFSPYLKQDGDKFALVALPAAEDPMLRRSQAIRVRDQLFVDGLQQNYAAFNSKMNASYLVWQKQSMDEILAERERKAEATERVILGIVMIGLGVAAAAAGARTNSSYGSSAIAGGVTAGVVGVSSIAQGIKISKEAEVHRQALLELGESINIEMAPQVIDYENKTKELNGTAQEQYQQWREFLAEIWALEKTPDKVIQ
ncbi:hypothetical protein ACTL6U_10880 [Rhodovibrionaceae bacterium A322]